MSFRSSSTAQGTAKSATCNIPTGTTTGDIMIAGVVGDGTGGAITWPSDWTAFTANAQSSPDGQLLGAAWKRATGSEPGSYYFEHSASGGSTIVGIASFSGRATGSDPVAQLTTPNTSANASPITLSLTGVPASASDDIVVIAAVDNTSVTSCSYAAPASYTEAVDSYETSFQWTNIGIFYRENVSSGATGTLQPVATLGADTGGYAGYVIRIPVAGAPPASKLLLQLMQCH